MKLLLTKLHNGWANLGDRDKSVLFMATPVVLVLVFYILVFQPLVAHYHKTQLYREQLSNSLHWLYENSALIDRMQNHCVRQRLLERTNGDISVFVADISRSFRLPVQLQTADVGNVIVTANNVSGSRAMAVLQAYVCHGFGIEDIQLVRKSEGSAEVDLSVRLSPSAVLPVR